MGGHENVIPVEGRVEEAQGHPDAGELLEVLDQHPTQRHAAIRDRHQVEIPQGVVPFDQLVRDAREAASDGDVVENTPRGAAKRLLGTYLGLGIRLRGSHEGTFVRLSGRS